MRNNLFRAILSLMLALCLLVGTLPLIVLAEEEKPSVDSEGYSLIWSYDQLREVAKFAQSHVRFRLAADIYEEDTDNNREIRVGAGAYFSLDLNGHTLSRKAMSLDTTLFAVASGSTLEIYDSSLSQTGTCLFNINYAAGICSVIRNNGGNVIIKGGRYIIKAQEIKDYAAVLYGESGSFTVYDGLFDSHEAEGGLGVKLLHFSYMYDLPTCVIYGGRFYSKYYSLEAHSYGNYTLKGAYFPFIFVLGGAFYTTGTEYTDGRTEGHFAYCNNHWGRVIVANGLVPAKSLNMPDQRYATGATKHFEKLTGEPGNGWTYAAVSPPPRIVSRQMPLEDRLYSLCEKDYLRTSKEYESAALWNAHKEEIEEEIARIDGFTVSKYDTEPTVLRIEDKGEIDSVRWYFSDSPDSRWSELGDYRDSTGPVTLNRPEQETTLYYRVVVTHKDGTEYEDIICVHHEEPVKMLGGTATIGINNAEFGKAVTALVHDAPAGQDESAYTYEWKIDGQVVGTEKHFSIDKAAYVGKHLTCTVKSTACEGALVTPAVTVQKGQNTDWPVFPTAKFGNGVITVSNAQVSQEYLFSTKPSAVELTEEDWKNAYEINADTGSFGLPYLGLEEQEGKTIYVYTRFEETSERHAGQKVLCTRLTLADVVPLKTLRFEDAVNDTLYIPFTGAGDTVELTYELDPVNANQWSAFTWRTSYPVSLVEPTGSVDSNSNTGRVTLKLITTGATSLTASYITNTEVVYKRVNIMVYDPENPTIGSGNVLYPMPDQTVMAGTVYVPQMPEFYPVPPADMAFSWTFVRRVGFSEERVTDCEVASIDPATGAVTTKIPGQVDVALIGPGGSAVDTFRLTVIENDGTVAVESVNLSQTALTLRENTSATLTAVVYPTNAADQTVVWASSDPSVATVDENGKVMAVSPGIAQITAGAGGITATCTVTVTSLSFGGGGLKGDVDGDGNITSTDARMTLQFYAGKIGEDKLNVAVADVDSDGQITSTDARLILQYYAGKITAWP